VTVPERKWIDVRSQKAIRGSSSRLTILELGIVVFKVGLGALAPSTDRVSVIFVENTSRREFKEVGTSLLRNEQEPDQ
jgi:hypothetical protein